MLLETGEGSQRLRRWKYSNALLAGTDSFQSVWCANGQATQSAGPLNAAHWRRFLFSLAVDKLSFGHLVAKSALPRVVGEAQAVLVHTKWCHCAIGCSASPMNGADFECSRAQHAQHRDLRVTSMASD